MFLYNLHTARDVRGGDNFVYWSDPLEENRQDHRITESQNESLQ